MAMATNTERSIPLWRRLLVITAWFTLGLVILVVALYLVVRHQHTSRLEQVLKELDEKDPTWRWEKMLEARPVLKPGEDNSEIVLRISRAIPRSWPDHKLDEKLQNLAPNMKLDAPRQEALQKILAVPPVPRLRDEARTLVNFPRGRIEVEMAENPMMTLLPNHQKVREIAALLRYDILDRLSRGKFDEAADSVHAMLNLSNVLDDDPFLIGQLIRIAVAAIALADTERILAQGELSDAKLAHLQKLLQHQMASTRMELAMRGERWFLHKTIVSITQGKFSTDEFAGLAGGGGMGGNSVWNWFMALGSREMARREHPQVLETMTRVVDATRLPIKEQFAAEAAIDAEVRTKGGPMLRLLLPATSKVNEAARRSVCAATAMHALLGVERYRLKHGKWPAKLDDCVPAFLNKVPVDPIDEAPLRYKILPDGVVVYSIGNDRKDDGGDVERMQKDFGYRLWNKDRRGIAPPPLPPEPAPMPMPGEGGPGAGGPGAGGPGEPNR